MIGAGVRVDGNINFTGVLRIQGETLGDVSCDENSSGTIVVDKSGSVTGTIQAPHIVVSGRVSGPLDSSESIEIQQGASVVGDAFYKAIDIQAGGRIEGSLTHRGLPDGDRLAHRHPMPKAASLPAERYDENYPEAVAEGGGLVQRLGGGRKLLASAVLLGALLVALFMNRSPEPLAPPVADAANKDSVAAPSAPATGGGPPEAQKALAPDAASRIPDAETSPKSGERTPPADPAGADPKTVVAIHGVNPAKPAGVILVIAKEPAVLIRKKRQDASDGTRIEVSRGATESITIGRNDIFRVESGPDLTIFYQGRKVAPKTIESGAWMAFVPQSP